MEKKYTQGEWYYPDAYSVSDDNKNEPPEYSISVKIETNTMERNYTIARVHAQSLEEVKANVALISAAPELLEASINLPKWLREAAASLEAYANRNGGTNALTPKLEWYADKIDAAITKATGGTNGKD